MYNKVRIVWNNEVGEIDSVTVANDSEKAATNALIEMIQGNMVSPGDSFTIEEVNEQPTPNAVE